MKYLDLKDKKYKVLNFSYHSWDNITERYDSFNARLEDILLLERDFVPNTVQEFHENINIYSKLSKVPKGIAKGKPFNFVSDPEEADVLLIDTVPTGYSSGYNSILKSKSTGMYIIFTQSDFPDFDNFLRKLENKYNISDFKLIYYGDIIRYSHNDFDILSSAYKWGAAMMKSKLLCDYYLDSLPQIPEETLKSIHKMLACSDVQTKELGLKMLIQYNPKEYPMYMTYVFYKGNSDISDLRKHSSYVNYYASYFHDQSTRFGRWSRQMLSTYRYYATGKDLDMLQWVENNSLEL